MRGALLAGCLLAAIAWWRRATLAVLLCLAVGCGAAGWVLSAAAARQALGPGVRARLDAAFGGFALESPGPAGAVFPVPSRLRLVEDAALVEGRVRVRAEVEAVQVRGLWQPADGEVSLNVDGARATEAHGQWTAGRVVEAPVSYRRAARYFNPGVTDLEADAALRGLALFGSIKSAWLVEAHGEGTRLDQWAARVRALVRRRLDATMAADFPVERAVAAAVLIGDRAGLPAEVRQRLQAAGTYHVLAISGGNIAVLTGLLWWGAALSGAGTRGRSLTTMLGLCLYAAIVEASPSVWRATVTAMVMMGGRLMDHRVAGLQALGLSLAVAVCRAPLDVRDVGAVLTFGATAALLSAGRLARAAFGREVAGVWGWVLATLLATAVVELVLLPVTARAFGQITVAGLLLNLLALPLMSVVQVAAMVAVAAGGVPLLDTTAGWRAGMAARGLLWSAGLVEVAPWLAPTIVPPAWGLVLAYYLGLAGLLWARRAWRMAGALCVGVSLVLMVSDYATLQRPRTLPGLTLTVLDVGQGDASLLTLPDGTSLLIDAGGLLQGSGGFDIGGRVVVPAVRAAGGQRLRGLVLTHGDPDHVGGASAVIRHLHPALLWEGLRSPADAAMDRLRTEAQRAGSQPGQIVSGTVWRFGDVTVRALHPTQGTEAIRRVGNDESVVLEVVYGEVALVLPGDIGARVERRLVAELTPTRRRVLKVAHHGSASSTSTELLDHWRPNLAIISCGRGNAFGHPAASVLSRLAARGIATYRTDLDGQVQLWTDGRMVRVRTAVPSFRRPARP